MCFLQYTLSLSDLPPPATRERPPGCKTVFVGGLPENATEQLIVEVFEQCGDIVAIRKSKKNFCHIRFAEEQTVDKALFLSGNVSHKPLELNTIIALHRKIQSGGPTYPVHVNMGKISPGSNCAAVERTFTIFSRCPCGGKAQV